MWISIQGYLGSICGYLGSIWDIYMPSIIPQQLATDPSHGRGKIAAICVNLFGIAGGAARRGAHPAAAQEPRAPTIGAALRPTGSGPTSTRLPLSYDAVAVGRAQPRPRCGAATEGVRTCKKLMSAV